jgi:glycosyltransferase involved in cell wall biosynthesis
MGNLIRVLHVIGKMDRGGAETMIMNLYRNIDRSKIQFDFIVHSTDKSHYDDEIKSLGGKIYSIPRYTGKNHQLYKKAWRRFFEEHSEYRIIHGHVRSTASIYLKIAQKYNLVTISHSHNTSSGTGISSIVKKILQYPIRYTADYLFACSKSAGEWLFGKKACQKANFFIVNNAIDTKNFIYSQNVENYIKRKLNIEGKFVIGHIGRFHPQKNHSLLIDIFQKLLEKNSDAILLLVGDGELRPKIKKKVQDLRLSDKVIFTGVRSDIPQLMQAMDLFVFPSLYEGLGIVAIEAQAAGIHCVVSDNVPEEAFITNLIEKVPLNSSLDTWTEIILNYRHYKKRDTSNQIISAGFDITETVRKLQKFYQDVIE